MAEGDPGVAYDYIERDLWPLAVPIDSLQPDPRNARVHPDRNMEAIKKSLAGFTQQKPIVVNGAGVCIAGSGTLMAARALGWTHIAVSHSSLTGAKAVAYAIADNQTAELAEWDDAVLAEMLAELLRDPDIDESLTGFDDDDMQRLLGPQTGEADPDDVPAPMDEAITQSGDLWILGDHRLLCGDSGSPADLDRLLGGQVIHLCNTDPPYNVKVEPQSNNAIAAGLSSFSRREDLQCMNSTTERGKKDQERILKKRREISAADDAGHHHQGFDLARDKTKAKGTTKQMRAKDRPLANDFVTDEAFDDMLDAWFGNIARVLIDGGGFYIWGGYANLGNYPPFLKKHGLYFSQGIIWDKLHPVLTRKDFMGAFEIAFYGWKEGAAHRYFGPHNATDLWHVKKVNPQNMVHLTEKPTELAVMAMQYSSRVGENVLDLFGGSGSTMIAAQQTGRHAFLMELDQQYCDVIVKRWENFTGLKAKRIPKGGSENAPVETEASGSPSQA